MSGAILERLARQATDQARILLSHVCGDADHQVIVDYQQNFEQQAAQYPDIYSETYRSAFNKAIDEQRQNNLK